LRDKGHTEDVEYYLKWSGDITRLPLIGYLCIVGGIKGTKSNPMNATAQMLKRHPVVIAIYLLITFYCIGVTIMAFYYYDHFKHRAGEGVQEGGGLIFLGDIGMFLFGGLFFLVCGCFGGSL
jgi:hypothetical protein